jgi:hypothetical protein
MLLTKAAEAPVLIVARAAAAAMRAVFFMI